MIIYIFLIITLTIVSLLLKTNKKITIIIYISIIFLLYRTGVFFIILGYLFFVFSIDITNELNRKYDITDFEFELNEGNNYYKIKNYNGDALRIKIPNEYNGKSVEIIGERAFSHARRSHKWGTEIKKIEIPSSILKIEDFAFDGNNLNKVELPNNLEYIGIAAFASNNLRMIIIPTNVKFIDKSAFVNNKNLVIYGNLGSEAERYAKSEGISFKELK